MIQALIKNWWILALCGILQAIISIIYFVMQNQDGPLTFPAWKVTVVVLGNLTLAAGVCAIIAGIWRYANGACWPLVVNGLALSALGAMYTGPVVRLVSFRTVALLVILTAISLGIFELATTRTMLLRRDFANTWFLGLAGAASVAFALMFLATGFRWIRLEPGSRFAFGLLGSYFGFSAVCLLIAALRLRGQGISRAFQRTVLPA